jgi:DNA-binding response OmpR family regulator
MSTILFVGQQFDYTHLMADMLQFEGFVVLLAADAEASICLAHEYRPDIILCDLAPERGGETIRQTLQLTEHTDNIPFLYLTTRDRQHMPVGARYIRKPFQINSLLALVGTLLISEVR